MCSKKLRDLLENAESPLRMREAIEALQDSGESPSEASEAMLEALRDGSVQVQSNYELALT